MLNKSKLLNFFNFLLILFFSRYLFLNGLWIVFGLSLSMLIGFYNRKELIFKLTPFIFFLGHLENIYTRYSNEPSRYFSLDTILMTYTFAFVANFVVHFVFKLYLKRYKLRISTLILLLLLLFIYFSPKNIYSLVAESFIYFYGLSFWYLIFETDDSSKFTKLDFLFVFNPALVACKIPIVPVYLQKNEAKNVTEFLNSLAGSARSFSLAFLFRIFNYFTIIVLSQAQLKLDDFIFFKFIDSHYIGLFNNLHVLLTNTFGFQSKLISLIVSGFQIILTTLSYVFAAVGFYQAFGYQIRLTGLPFKKIRYYHEFFSSIYYHYNKAIAYLFFKRIRTILIKLRLSKNYYTTIFLTLFLGFFIFGFEKDVFFSRFKLSNIDKYILESTIYFGLMAAASTFSIWLKDSKKYLVHTHSNLFLIIKLLVFSIFFQFILGLRWFTHYRELNLIDTFRYFFQ